MGRIFGITLVILGATLVAFAPLLRWWVAPALLLPPTNQYTVLTATSADSAFEDPTTGELREGQTVSAVTTIRGNPAESSAEVAVQDVFTRTVTGTDATADPATVLTSTAMKLAVNRSDAKLSSCCGANVAGQKVPMAGMAYRFGPHVNQKTYDIYDPVTHKAWPVAFQSSMQISGVPELAGLTVYHFAGTVPETVIDQIDVPGTRVNRPEPVITVAKTYTVSRDIFVEPQTGTVVRVAENRRTSLKIPGEKYVAARLFKGTLTWDDATIARQAQAAKQTLADVHHVKVTFPLAVFGTGIVLLGAGMVLFWRAELRPGPARVRRAPDDTQVWV